MLVVGGNGFIGSAVVDRLRAEGATAVSASRGGEGGIRLDAADDASVEDGVAAVLAEHGRLDGLVVTAAPAAQTLDPARSGDPDAVAEAVAAKSLVFLRVANAVIPIMREAGFGRILGVSGQLAGVTGSIVASVRNSALDTIAKNLADATAGSGVLVNTVNPGTVAESPAAEVARGLGGESSPAQIADLAAFLLSPRNAVSGSSIAIGHRLRGVV